MYDGLVIGIFCFLTILGCFGLFAVTYLVYQRLLCKGYMPIFSGSIIFACVLTSTIIGFESSKELGRPFTGIGFFYLPLIILPIFLLLPIRGTRRKFGPRRAYFPFRLAGLICFVGATALVWHFLSNGQLDVFIDLNGQFAFILLPVIGVMMFRLQVRINAPEMEIAVSPNERDPVLYLRTFKRDIDIFVPDAPEGLKHLSTNIIVEIQKSFNLPDPAVISLRFEEFFSREIDARLGPLVALGSPEDYIPPVGASRMYARDSDWQQKLAQLADRARLIIMEPDESVNLAWELQYLRQNSLHRKLVIVTRPSMAILTRWSFLYWYTRYVRWARGVKETSWPAFARRMSEYGYEIGKEPPYGSVFGFDLSGRAILLTTGATDPKTYIDVIVAWAQGDYSVGRNVEAACACCNVLCYISSDEQAAPLPILCKDCTRTAFERDLDAMQRFVKAIPRYPMLFQVWVCANASLFPLLFVSWGSYLKDAPAWLAIWAFICTPIALMALPYWLLSMICNIVRKWWS